MQRKKNALSPILRRVVKLTAPSHLFAIYKLDEIKTKKKQNTMMNAELVFGFDRTHLDDSAPWYPLGVCRVCQYTGHSHKHCPLSRCTHCSAYGHTFSVCPKRAHQKLIASKKHTPVNLASLSDLTLTDTRMSRSSGVCRKVAPASNIRQKSALSDVKQPQPRSQHPPPPVKENKSHQPPP